MSATSTTKTLSTADVAKLEHAFATDPSSDSYKPLAEAYLGMARFMEAMVVCKKGVKAHPDRPEPRILLARVYAEQGKDKKAIEELQAAIGVSSGHKEALRMAATLEFKSGENAAGKAHLLKAHEADPDDQITLALMDQWAVEVPVKAAPLPPPPPPPVAPPVVEASAPPVLAKSGPPRSSTGDGQIPVSLPRPLPLNGHANRTAPAVRRTAVVSEDLESTQDRIRPLKKKGPTRGLFFLMAAIVPLALGTYVFTGQQRAKRNRELKKHLSVAAEQLKRDSFEGYKKAVEAADGALDVDPDSGAAHGYLAYAWAVRWADHGGGDDARKAAEDHLAAAKRSGEVSSHLYAAEALLTRSSGKPDEARAALAQKVAEFDAQGRASSLMLMTLGILQTDGGDFERAKDSLDKAQALAGTDPRVYAALANLFRRRGQDAQAEQNYLIALRYEKGHPESLLGEALLELDKPAADYPKVALILKRLMESDAAVSPRQLATAHMARAFLISRVSAELPSQKPDVQKEWAEKTGVPLDKAKAQAELQRAEADAMAASREDPDLYLIRSKRFYSEGQFDAAAKELKEAIRREPTRAQLYVELAKTLLAKPGGEKEAAEVLTAALRSVGESPKLMVLLGQAYQRQGKLDDAIVQFAKATTVKGKNPEARLALGVAYREKKDIAKAAEALEKAVQEFIGQNGRTAETYGELGRLYEEKGDRAKAEDNFKKALNADANVAAPYFYYARLLSADKKAHSTELAKKYLELEPKGPYAAEAQKLAQ